MYYSMVARGIKPSTSCKWECWNFLWMGYRYGIRELKNPWLHLQTCKRTRHCGQCTVLTCYSSHALNVTALINFSAFWTEIKNYIGAFILVYIWYYLQPSIKIGYQISYWNEFRSIFSHRVMDRVSPIFLFNDVF